MVKKKLEKACIASINICLRKTKFTKNISASSARNPEFLKKIIHFDAGYSILNKIRSSPSYWESKKRDLLSMIRQLGKPTIFLTLSAGEKFWPELLQALQKSSFGRPISIREAYMLSENEKNMLIKNDPVTCARYFDFKITKFMNLMKQNGSFFGNYLVEDNYSRVEFQMRGSPHEHIFLWLKGAPIYDSSDKTTVDKCLKFIDNFITCEYDANNPLIALQKHRHSHTCRKGNQNKKKCRFNFPIPVMSKTMILEPLTDEEKSPILKESVTKVQNFMNSLYKKDQNIPFENILTKLEMTEESYILSLRYPLKRSQVFLKRGSMEVGINCYNKSMLNLFESNMDIQFILEEYGLATYILNYISKADSGLSKLMLDAASDINMGNSSIKDKFRNIANIFLNSNLMSAQEASYHVLSLPLSKMSRQCIFINTSPINERVLMLKSKKDLDNLQSNSTEIYRKDCLKKYSERPKELENICLADFCSLHMKTATEIDKNEDNDKDVEQEKCNQRIKPAIIRYRRYKLTQDPYNYYREQVLLFLPWRCELEEVEKNDCKKKYYIDIEQIETNRKKYSLVGDETLETAIQTVQKEIQEMERDEASNFESQELLYYEQEIDILEQAGLEKDNKCKSSRYTSPKRISEEDIYKEMHKLNNQQRYVVYMFYTG